MGSSNSETGRHKVDCVQIIVENVETDCRDAKEEEGGEGFQMVSHGIRYRVALPKGVPHFLACSAMSALVKSAVERTLVDVVKGLGEFVGAEIVSESHYPWDTEMDLKEIREKVMAEVEALERELNGEKPS